MEFIKIIETHRGVFFSILASLLFASSALGVQRTALSLYGNEFLENFSSLVIVGGAISLSIFGISKAFGNLLGGRWADSRGRKLSSNLGLVLIGIGGLVMAVSSTFISFLFGNSVSGLGIGVLFAASTISLTDLATPAHRAKGISLMELSVYIGTTIGALFSGVIINNSLERLQTAFIAAFVIVLIPWIFVSLRKETIGMAVEETKKPFQSARQKLIALKDEWMEDHTETQTSTQLDTLIQNYPESTREPTSVPIRYSDPTFLLSFLTGIVSRISDTAIILIFPLLIIEYGFTLFQLAIITSSFTLAWSIGIAIAGLTADNFGRKLPLSVGLIIEGLGYLVLFNLGLNNFFIAIVTGSLIAGLGRGIYFPIPPSIVTDIAPPKERGRMLGMYRFVLDSGYVIGSIFFILIVELRNDKTDTIAILLPPMRFVMVLIIINGFLAAIILKDPRPGFRQQHQISDHLNLVKTSINQLTQALHYYTHDDRKRAQENLDSSKTLEREADLLLEKMNYATYSKTFKESDAVELIQFSNKVDKALGYMIRSLRKFLLIDEKLSDQFLFFLRQYGLITRLLIETTVETFDLMHVRFHLAIEQSYQVNEVEAYLDQIHKDLYQEIVAMSDVKKPLTLLLITNAIDSLEKGANILEDSAELLRLISFKH